MKKKISYFRWHKILLESFCGFFGYTDYVNEFNCSKSTIEALERVWNMLGFDTPKKIYFLLSLA